MNPESIAAIREALGRLNDTSAQAFSRAKAAERVMQTHDELTGEYEEALNFFKAQTAHSDFGTLLDRIR